MNFIFIIIAIMALALAVVVPLMSPIFSAVTFATTVMPSSSSSSLLSFYVFIRDRTAGSTFKYDAAIKYISTINVIPDYAPQLPIIASRDDYQRYKSFACDARVPRGASWIEGTRNPVTGVWEYDTGGAHHRYGALVSQNRSEPRDGAPNYWNAGEPNNVAHETKIMWTCDREYGWSDVSLDAEPYLIVQYVAVVDDAPVIDSFDHLGHALHQIAACVRQQQVHRDEQRRHSVWWSIKTNIHLVCMVIMFILHVWILVHMYRTRVLSLQGLASVPRSAGTIPQSISAAALSPSPSSASLPDIQPSPTPPSSASSIQVPSSSPLAGASSLHALPASVGSSSGAPPVVINNDSKEVKRSPPPYAITQPLGPGPASASTSNHAAVHANNGVMMHHDGSMPIAGPRNDLQLKATGHGHSHSHSHAHGVI